MLRGGGGRGNTQHGGGGNGGGEWECMLVDIAEMLQFFFFLNL